MAHPSLTEWQLALSEMEKSLDQGISTLDQYERNWASLLSSPDTTATRTEPESRFLQLDQRLREWDSRLQAAEEVVKTVENQLHEAESAVGRWQAMFSGWQEVIKRD